jgi:hypothetical protein
MNPPQDAMLRRLERDTVIVGVGLAAGAVVLWPTQPGRAAGVLGGLALIALSYQGIRAGVDGLWQGAPPGPPGPENEASPPRPPASRGFVKFFTRHAILAGGAYVMMARFEFDPMAMLVGVTAPAVAATVEVVRTVRARQGGSHSRSS